MAILPFTHDPRLRLQPNRHKAMKVYIQQVKKFNKHPNDMNDYESENKLQHLTSASARSTEIKRNPKLHTLASRLESQLVINAIQTSVQCLPTYRQWLESKFNPGERNQWYEQTCQHTNSLVYSSGCFSH